MERGADAGGATEWQAVAVRSDFSSWAAVSSLNVFRNLPVAGLILW